MKNLFFPSRNNILSIDTLRREIYLTDLERNLTFSGIVESLCELKENIKVSLLDVTVYEYSSSNPLYKLPKISFSRPKNQLHKEELNNS
jgi:hypothetical protein